MNSSRVYAEAYSAFFSVTFVKVSTNSWGEIISPMTGKDFPEYELRLKRAKSLDFITVWHIFF
tara:strand:+ start:7184 stop:7372 length:189 start_codon:yes stop_codon:yes gene_type:complete